MDPTDVILILIAGLIAAVLAVQIIQARKSRTPMLPVVVNQSAEPHREDMEQPTSEPVEADPWQCFFNGTQHKVMEIINGRSFRILTPEGAPHQYGKTTYVTLIGVDIPPVVQAEANQEALTELRNQTVLLERDNTVPINPKGDNELRAYVTVKGRYDDYGLELIKRVLAQPWHKRPFDRRSKYNQAYARAARRH